MLPPTPPGRAAPLAELARVYGTPTDLARIVTETVWTQDSDGAVLVFGRPVGQWHRLGRSIE